MDKNTRICIIGGGPAGLSAGMYLEKKGYDGYCSLEWEEPWRPEIRNLYPNTEELLRDWNAFLKTVLKER